MIEIGSRISLDFEVRAILKGERWQGAFSELVTGPTVVSVYMRNNTKSCDRQVGQLNLVAAELREKGYNLIALSRDTVGSHLRYSCKLNLGFTLVSDPDFQFAGKVDSMVEKKLYGRTFIGPSRSAYLLKSGGIVSGIVEKVDSENHADQLRQLLKI